MAPISRKPFSAGVCTSISADTGVLIDSEDIEGFADAMCTLLADPEYARKLGRTAPQRCRERFDWQVVAQRWNSLLQSPLELVRNSIGMRVEFVHTCSIGLLD